MSHEDLEMLLPDYAAGQLPRLQRWRVSRHLRGCSSCRQAVEDYRQIRASVRKWSDDIPQPSPENYDRFMSFIAETEPAPDDSARTLPVWIWKTVPLTAAGLLAGLNLTLGFQLADLKSPRDFELVNLTNVRGPGSQGQNSDTLNVPVAEEQRFVALQIDINTFDDALQQFIEFSEFQCSLRGESGEEPFGTWQATGRSQLNLLLPAQPLGIGKIWTLTIEGRRDYDNRLVPIRSVSFVTTRPLPRE
ncbi:MAG TPA: zf-HC2 domain-containing protein [Acidobacteriota bacterium]|nr:zf-HC2 domain-containing protein [Acidobacteriota bacterium]